MNITPTPYRNLSPLREEEMHRVWDEYDDFEALEDNFIHHNLRILTLENKIHDLQRRYGLSQDFVEMARVKSRQIAFKLTAKPKIVDLIGANDYVSYFEEVYEKILPMTYRMLRTYMSHEE